MRAKMLERWIALSKRLDVDEKTAQEIYHMIVYYYMQPWRAYHTLAHITHGLSRLDEIRDLAANPDELELSWWFHDVVYDTWTNDSEHRSAQLAYFFTTTLLGLPSLVSIRVFHKILKTDHKHNPRVIVGDDKLMLDIDLSELGETPAQFNMNSMNIRKEYWWVPEETYRRKRADILKNFLEHPSIYFTPHFRDKYEKQARLNLQAEIQRLRSAL